MKPAVIIVGGGIAGLMAARLLQEKFEVTILEHGKTVGGRIQTIEDNGLIIEAGAEFIHGDVPETFALMKEAGLGYQEVKGRMLRTRANALTEQDDMPDGWERLMKAMKNQQPDITLRELLDKDFGRAADASLRRQVEQYAQGFDVADPEKVSVRSLYDEWAHEGNNYRPTIGYAALVQFLERICRKKGCRILTGETVKQVNWTRNSVKLTTASGKIFTAGKALVTVPVGVLQNPDAPCGLGFTPSLTDHLNASLQIGFGAALRVILEFEEPLWPADCSFIFSDQRIPTWWTQYPAGNNLLTGWAGGPMASEFTGYSDEQVLAVAVGSISSIFDIKADVLRTKIRRSWIFNWQDIPSASGAYSYATPSSGGARIVLNTPVAGTIYFAGEGIYDGPHAGTVEAALVSGKRVAEKMLLS